RRQPAQLVVDQRQQLLGGVRVTLLDGGQHARDFGHRRGTSGARPAAGRPQPGPLRGPEPWATPCVLSAEPAAPGRLTETRRIPPAWRQALDFFGPPLVIEPSPGQLPGDAGLLPVRQFDEVVVRTRRIVVRLSSSWPHLDWGLNNPGYPSGGGLSAVSRIP